MRTRTPFARLARASIAALAFAAALASIAASCGTHGDQTLTGLCEGRTATHRVEAVVDTILPFGGAALAELQGKHFVLRLTFSPPAPTGPTAGTAECQGAMGSARFAGELPERLRGATAADSTAGWRIDGDTILVDLNPRARDNNLVMSLPLAGGRGHWALSTFAGEVARGATTGGR
ncbi:MAG: hypothetical protein HOQ12_14150 [Gemmatimonadaceae bacterium]|nr:hypothetical protein [Gemmatimonadaceae bacterium]NUQ92711.1 hypothetical protein [Gemmatimonadaceae bacterium]NUR20674.1 hypothetical protein [Gemmatimonadaceae bacterium]